MRKWIKTTGIILEFVVIGFVIVFVVVTNVVKAEDKDLIKAADNRRWERFKRILDEGVDVNAKGGNRNYTALTLASKYGQVEVAKLFLEKGADVNAEEINGKTAQFQASKHGDTQVVDFLKARGAKQ